MRRATVAVTALVVGAVVFAVIALHAHRNPNQGEDTTCGDFLKMNHAQQVAVLVKARTWVGHREEGVAYYRSGCQTTHPSDLEDPIKYVQG